MQNADDDGGGGEGEEGNINFLNCVLLAVLFL